MVPVAMVTGQGMRTHMVHTVPARMAAVTAWPAAPAADSTALPVAVFTPLPRAWPHPCHQPCPQVTDSALRALTMVPEQVAVPRLCAARQACHRWDTCQDTVHVPAQRAASTCQMYVP